MAFSAIGEYVHYSQEKYKKFRIGRTEQRGLNFIQSYTTAKKELLSSVSQTKTKINLTELQAAFNMTKEKIRENDQGAQLVSNDSLENYFIQEVNRRFDTKNQKINHPNQDIHELCNRAEQNARFFCRHFWESLRREGQNRRYACIEVNER